MTRKALILGDHQLKSDIQRQYVQSGFTISTDYGEDNCHFDEVVILTHQGKDDNYQLKVLQEVAEHQGCSNARVHLMLNNSESLTLVRRNGFVKSIDTRLEINPFTLADEWARKVRLDYKPITLQSEYRAHLVVFGSNDYARQIAINAALVSHFPNYTRDTSLRTRITIIDNDIDALAEQLTSTYRHLFDNSYYRRIVCDEKCTVTDRHRPIYTDTREDFVDIEWEFVKGSVYNRHVQRKLALWANDPSQLLTIAVAKGQDTENLALTMHLPNCLSENGIPVYVWLKDTAMINTISQPAATNNLTPIGMEDNGYDISTPLVKMGMTVNYIYNQCYDDNIATEKSSDYDMPIFSVTIDDEVRQRQWHSLNMIKKMSSIYNAMTILTKLRSVGIEPDEIDKFHDLSAREINLLAEVEHNRWSVEELILGFRPCTDDELKEINNNLKLKKEYRDQMIHYDLRSYRDLRNDQTGKNVNIYDICLSGCLPLIMHKA